MQIRTVVAATCIASLAVFNAAAQQPDATVDVDIVIAAGVTDREPVGAATAFPRDVGQVTAWTRVSGAANTVIEHVWRHGDLEFVVPLNIGGSPWRTWSTKAIPIEWAGDWTVEVRDAAGNTVGTAAFTVGS